MCGIGIGLILGESLYKREFRVGVHWDLQIEANVWLKLPRLVKLFKTKQYY